MDAYSIKTHSCCGGFSRLLNRLLKTPWNGINASKPYFVVELWGDTLLKRWCLLFCWCPFCVLSAVLRMADSSRRWCLEAWLLCSYAASSAADEDSHLLLTASDTGVLCTEVSFRTVTEMQQRLCCKLEAPTGAGSAAVTAGGSFPQGCGMWGVSTEAWVTRSGWS